MCGSPLSRCPFWLPSLLRAADIGSRHSRASRDVFFLTSHFHLLFLNLIKRCKDLKSSAHGNRSARRPRVFSHRLPCASTPHHQSVDLRSGPTHRARFQDCIVIQSYFTLFRIQNTSAARFLIMSACISPHYLLKYLFIIMLD